MARPNELSNKYLDEDFQAEIKKAYSSISRFASIAGIDYQVAKRVITNQPCRTEEIDLVFDKWQRLNPIYIKELIDAGPENFDEVCSILLDILAEIGQ